MSESQALDATEIMRLLADIEQRSQASGLGLPATRLPDPTWDCLAYTLGGVQVASAMHHVTEMLPYPNQITHVPGSKPWMLGLANVRGTLLPVIDLQVYLGVQAVAHTKAARMLVVDMRDITAGLLVPGVTGMRHFKEQFRVLGVQMRGALGAYVFDAFVVDEQTWPVFDLSALTADPEFRLAAS